VRARESLAFIVRDKVFIIFVGDKIFMKCERVCVVTTKYCTFGTCEHVKDENDFNFSPLRSLALSEHTQTIRSTLLSVPKRCPLNLDIKT
jgi:hypothetical protein